MRSQRIDRILSLIDAVLEDETAPPSPLVADEDEHPVPLPTH